MTVYPSSRVSARVTWPEPIESVWSVVSSDNTRRPGYKRRDLGLADRLFIGAVVNLPAERRPWGSLTWLAQVFATSRTTVYAIGERARTSMAALPSGRPARAPTPAHPAGVYGPRRGSTEPCRNLVSSTSCARKGCQAWGQPPRCGI